MGELKTKENDGDVEAFLNSVENDKKRSDSFTILELMKKITNDPPRMWGDSMVGFGRYSYTYKSGHSGEWFITGFSPRKQSLTLYLMTEFEANKELMEKLGKYKTGKSCLYIKTLDDINMDVLETLLQQSVDSMKKKEPK